ncbi:MAG: hypothetical protein IPK32_13315 [Verrucomicrobiaceae bacterium]|nr:hypothetical protein [Verrucomicrobiaceae bacterium]
METSTTPASSPPPPATPRGVSGCWKWGCISIFILATGAGLLVWRMIDQGYDFAKHGIDWLATKLSDQRITETFRQEVTKIVSTDGDVLELATLETSETVTKSDTKTLFDNLIYLGTTESEIRVPVVYRYHLKLSDPWKLHVKEGRCIVIAPPVRPTLPPAIRTEGMEKKTASGWLRFNAAENLTELEKSLTPRLEKKAGANSQIPGVRESCRSSVAKFVQRWILREQDGNGSIRDIIVIFPDEAAMKDPFAASNIPVYPLQNSGVIP